MKPSLPQTEMISDEFMLLDTFELLHHLTNIHQVTGRGNCSCKTSLLHLCLHLPRLKRYFIKVLFQPTASGASVKNNIFDNFT
jgi:hypothetical protein